MGMVVCEVTGQTVPEDETVVFQGRRVSAEGKQILVDRVNAGEALPGELEDASRWARLGGAILDAIPFVVVVVAAYWLLDDLTTDPFRAAEPGVIQTDAAVGVAMGVLGMIYFPVFHARGGQTPGKMLMKTKVVFQDGGPLTGSAAFVRGLVHTGPNLLVAAVTLVVSLVSMELIGAVGLLELAAGLFGLVNALLIFRSSKRCLHDDAAGTRVVSTRA